MNCCPSHLLLLSSRRTWQYFPSGLLVMKTITKQGHFGFQARAFELNGMPAAGGQLIISSARDGQRCLPPRHA